MSGVERERSYPLSDEQVDSFRALGRAFLPGLLTQDEAATHAPAVREAFDEVYGPLSEQDRVMYLADSMWTRSRAVRDLVWSPRIAEVAASLLGAPAVRLCRDVAFFKEPGGDATPWHQDSLWEPIDGNDMVVVWIALTPVAPDMSPVCFVDGSHRGGRREMPQHGGATQEEFEAELRGRGERVTNFSPMRRGDATAHTGWTLHGSPPNVSDHRREAIVIIYYRDGVRLNVPDVGDMSGEEREVWNRMHRHHMSQRFPGLSVGDPAVSELCPIVYP